MTVRMRVVSLWVGAGTRSSPFRPRLLNDYPGITYSDVTGQALVPPPVNLMVADLLVDDAQSDVIEADTRYLVLWSETDNAPA